MDYRIESDEKDVVLEEETTEEEIISDYEEERKKETKEMISVINRKSMKITTVMI